MLCGLPGSGKSSVAAALARRLGDGDVEVLSTETIGTRQDRYGELRERLDELAGRRRYVILDGSFFRRELRDAVRATGYPVLLAYLKCPLRVCLHRNEMRDSVVDSGGVIVMHHRFEAPEDDESPVIIQTEQVTPEVAGRLVYRAVNLVESTGTRRVRADENDPVDE